MHIDQPSDPGGSPAATLPPGADSSTGHLPPEVRQRCEKLVRELQEVRKERDALAHRLAAMQHTGSPSDPDKALLAIRQARDAVLEKNRQLMDQVAAIEDQLAETQYERDDALKKIGILASERDEALAELAVARVKLAAEPQPPRGEPAERAESQRTHKQLEEDRTALTAQVLALRAQLAAFEKPPATGEPQPDDCPPPPMPERFDADDAAVSIAALAGALRLLREDPANLQTLEDFAAQLHVFATSAQCMGLGAFARIGEAADGLAKWMSKNPAKLPACLRTFDEFLAVLDLMNRAPEPVPGEIAGAIVYAVDDDVENCECIAMSLEKNALQTRYASHPQSALAELEVGACDLVVLDVDMPAMDGFELHANLRRIAHHERTPVLFVSGLMSTRIRVETMDPAINDFLPKPYNLNELSLKVLTMIARNNLTAQAAAAV